MFKSGVCSLVLAAMSGSFVASAFAPPTGQEREAISRALETVAEVAAKVGNVCPGRVDASLQSLIAAMNDAPERADRKRVNVPQGAGVYEYFDAFAEMVADAPKMEPRRIMWLGADALARGVDENSGFVFTEVLQKGSRASPGLRLGRGALRLVVQQVDVAGPAAIAGVLVGDRLVSIDGRSTALMHADDVLDLLLGANGTAVRLVLERNGEMLERIVQRAIDTREVTGRMQDGILVITVPAFTLGLSTKVKALVEHARRENSTVAGYVIDLRQNEGGLFDEVVELADAFIDEGVLFTHVPISECNSTYFQQETHSAKRGGIAPDAPVVLLIGPETAAGAEMFAAAMMDNGRAQSVGRRTFGRGTVQTLIPLRSVTGGALRVTTSEFVTARGRHIDGQGVVPTVEVSLDEDALSLAISLISGK